MFGSRRCCRVYFAVHSFYMTRQGGLPSKAFETDVATHRFGEGLLWPFQITCVSSSGLTTFPFLSHVAVPALFRHSFFRSHFSLACSAPFLSRFASPAPLTFGRHRFCTLCIFFFCSCTRVLHLRLFLVLAPVSTH